MAISRYQNRLAFIEIRTLNDLSFVTCIPAHMSSLLSFTKTKKNYYFGSSMGTIVTDFTYNILY